MATTQAPPAHSGAERVPPTRFREAEERSQRLGRPLRLIGRVHGGLDEELMGRVGRAMTERDELGARLADAIRMRAGDPGRVTMGQVRTALEHGIDAVSQPPPALAAFFAEVERIPDWVDWDQVAAGGGVFRRFGTNAADALLQLSLVGGYRFGGPPELLAATGGLAGDQALRRLGETQKWAVSLTEPGAMLPPTDGRPGGEGWRLTVHVRVMHALVNASFEPTWDVDRWGVPINQADQAATLGLFDATLLLGVRALGVPVRRRDSRAVMHLWKYVGHLMGVDPDFLVDDERARHRINYHILMAQSGASEAGAQLSQAIVAAQLQRTYPGWPSRLQGPRGRFERERLLSMLTTFLGTESMRELGLPLRPPWAHAYIVGLNQWRYRVLGRTRWGKRRLDAWGRRSSQKLLDSCFGGQPEDVAELRA